ncbi:PREDICTED: uncharacterized protein LOC104812003 [Tarenaya hassleriana]|uniref:uncharacterized protein LOC104812003 n=1 Tax=Tarenaya hassleriana TaxID=28532 RepID=UPI00053C2384|nr:PREDICTED: uncharacterized protein LOC104812003 [Tarenaya hassleriana]
MAQTFISSHGHQTKLLQSPHRRYCEFCILPKSAVYRCIECDANLCGDCFKIPQQISHNHHQGHVLRLMLTPKLFYGIEPSPNYNGLYFLICKGCHYISYPRGHYRCDECEFSMCVECGISITSKIPLGWENNEEFSHWSDMHRLVRCRFREYGLHVENVLYECNICELSMWGTGYACLERRCNNFIHESCIGIPRVMRYPLHSHHTLARPDLMNLDYKYLQCKACRRNLKPFGNEMTYDCSECEFALHFQCVTSTLRSIKFGSHEHSLASVRLIYSRYRCRVCEQPVLNHGLRCMECNEYFHVKCVSAPREWKHERHEHKLRLSGVSVRGSLWSEYSCDVCEGMIKGATAIPIYGCKHCEFYAHIECVLSPKDGLEQYSSSLWREDDNQNKGTHDSNYPSIKKMKKEIHDHPLRLQDASNKLCEMCNLQINDQAYACDDCHAFWVHKECGELPQTLVDHPFHPLHKLRLVRRPLKNIFVCDVCGDASKGFNFYCRSCDFVIDIKCAFLSKAGQTFYDKHGGKTLEHALHQQHKLTLANFGSYRERRCKMCGELLLGLSYVCKRCVWDCSFHKACMEWPSSVEGHPIPPHHRLHLGDTYSWSIPYLPKCFACGDRIASYFGYKTVNSENGLFYYHIECGTSLARLLRRGGHPHLFYYVHIRPSKGGDSYLILSCACCGQEVKNSYYRCIKCSLYFHLGCLCKAKWLPSAAKHEQHMHLLSLKNYVDYGGYYCDACEESRDSQHPCYACDDCGFVVHVECIVSEENASSVTLEEIQGDDGVKIQECS